MKTFVPGTGLAEAHIPDRGHLAGASIKVTAWHRKRAIRAIACFAADANDAADLLAMLGLDPKEGR